MKKAENAERVYSQRVKIIAHKDILSFKEALIYLDVSESMLYKLTSKNAIKFTKPNKGKLYFKKSDLNDWMLQNESIGIEDLEDEIFNHLNKNSDG